MDIKRIVKTADLFYNTMKRAQDNGEWDELLKDENWVDPMKGGRADKCKPSDFDKEQLIKGAKVELEHTGDKRIALNIAMDHLSESPTYYRKLEIMEGEHD